MRGDVEVAGFCQVLVVRHKAQACNRMPCECEVLRHRQCEPAESHQRPDQRGERRYDARSARQAKLGQWRSGSMTEENPGHEVAGHHQEDVNPDEPPGEARHAEVIQKNKPDCPRTQTVDIGPECDRRCHTDSRLRRVATIRINVSGHAESSVGRCGKTSKRYQGNEAPEPRGATRNPNWACWRPPSGEPQEEAHSVLPRCMSALRLAPIRAAV